MKKKLIGLVASAGFMFSLLTVAQYKGENATFAASASYSAVGQGTEKDPWQIGSADQWNDLAAKVNDTASLDLSGKYFLLTANIDIGSTTVGIGSSNMFKGNFNGNNKTITINYSDFEGDYKGVFGVVASGASVSNLFVEGTVKAKADAGSKCFAGIVAENHGTIDGCINYAAIITNGGGCQYGGGVCGKNSGTISNCGTETAFTIGTGDSQIGGICGYNDTTGIIRDCTNSAPYKSNFTVGANSESCGGIVGLNGGKVYNCTNKQLIEGVAASSKVGGIVGNNTGDVYNSINDAKTTGSSTNIGGLVGYNSGNVMNSVNSKDVEVTNADVVGTICGNNVGKIENCVNYKNVKNTGSTNVGSFCGQCGSVAKIINCFDASTSASASVGKNDGSQAPTKISLTQASENYAAVYDGDDKVFEGKALLDLLNEYIDDPANSTVVGSFDHWSKDKDSNPLPTQFCYKVTIAETEHGTISIYSNYVQKDQTFKVLCNGDEGYVVSSLSYNDGEVTDIMNSKRITMPSKPVTINAVFTATHTCSGTKHDAVPATCYVVGTKEYYECTCGKFYEDEKCSKYIGDQSKLDAWLKGLGKVNILFHNVTYVPGKDATSSEPGYESCYKCELCGNYFTDNDLSNEEEVIIGAQKDYEYWTLTAGKVEFKGLSTGAIVGIAVGGGVALLAAAYFIMFAIWKKTGKGLAFLFPGNKAK